MKSNIQNVKPRVEYPCLKSNREGTTIILFRGPRLGMVVGGNLWPLGHYSDAWNMDNMVPFNGEVVLSND